MLFLAFIDVFAQEREFQIWNLNNACTQLTNRMTLGVKEKMHFTPGTGQVDLVLGDVSVTYDVNAWLEAGVGGRLMYFRNENGWMQEKRPMLFGDISGSYHLIKLDFSNRIEYRFFESGGDHFRHRQMFTVEMPPFPVSWFSVYLAEEGFIRFDRQRLHLARVYAGTRLQCSETLDMKVYYVLQKQKNSAVWFTSDVVGLNMYVSF